MTAPHDTTQASPRDAATERQVQAADPTACTWLSANAGSGKTRVLTDRVARLLLADAPPQNILCLTYTKAAASEMQNRLFKRLGEWAMLPDAELARELANLGAPSLDDPETLRKARRLFARAIETPGGLKIQTIHSFCAAILRRFPLEAGLTPGFTEMDEAAQADLRAAVLADLAEAEPAIYRAMAMLVSDMDMTSLCAEVEKHRTEMPRQVDPDQIADLIGMERGLTEQAAYASVLVETDPGSLTHIADILAGQSKTMVDFARDLRTVVARDMDGELLALLVKRCLYASGANQGLPKPGALTKKAEEALGPLSEDVRALQNRVSLVVDDLKSIAAAEQTEALYRFAAAYLPRLEAAKARLGLLDFDDLIERTETLLSRPGIADWVLYRLDGGIDHILVDEAQDTSPRQWRVIEHLTREMTAGEGTRAPGDKTLFVVGDLKQSIYSFQGADPEGFGRMRDSFADRLGAPGPGLSQLDLAFSFRSAAPVLAAVDATFAENTAGLGGEVRHLPFRADMPGRVDLWPVIEPAEGSETGEWSDPVDHISEDHHTVRMARRVANEIARMIDTEVLWEGPENRPRRITCGDVLILVQGRQKLFHEIIAACKTAGLAVAGADVLPLGQELAFKDLMALLSFLATPEDDLSLAACLRSPLFGWSEAQLYDLAAGRDKAFLWQTLRRRAEEFPETHARLTALRDEADFLRPYELLERVLIRDRGRARLIGRLGDEAADGIDALLTQALDYETTEAPSLTGFLAAMEGADIAVKRAAEGRGNKIRVMTVHGAKGLESPIVILPDCGPKRARGQIRDRLLLTDDGPPIWRPDKAGISDHIGSLADGVIEARRDEGQRLLYVAMTRAEQWLIVGAAADPEKMAETWWDQVAAGLHRLEAAPFTFPFGLGHRLEGQNWAAVTPPEAEIDGETDQSPALPDWAGQPAGTPPQTTEPRAPSGLGGAKALPGEAALPEDEALARGTRLHLLLEHLPRVPPAGRAELAARLLPGLDTTALTAEAEAVLAAPALAPIFAADALAEVEITGPAGALGPMRGTIDRLIVAPDRILAVDFKSNAVVPATPQDVPEGLLRQMGAYAAMLAPLYPDRRIETALLWTRTALLMPLPADLIDAALLRALHEGVSPASAPLGAP